MRKSVALRLASIPAAVLASMGSAHAALDTAVTTAVTAATDDMKSAVLLIIGGMVVFWGLKKLGTKMGWF
ncbi:hypothetical protein [Ramlibacter sp. 2FC]|uniref:hypothetical protein n=1 Tax=Ramlibacter sp. 2FC TaxID=2502188 RepID=UPI0010FA56C2|nr:hypothetical protein [Ramlibacter sp. 2FC]